MKSIFTKTAHNFIAHRTPSEKILIPSHKRLLEKLHNFKGPFQLISDFDATLTKFNVNGVRVSTISMLTKNVLNDEEYKKAKQLFEKYHPVEVDPKIGLEEKAELMTKWWEQEYAIISQANFTKRHLESIVDITPIFLRHGVDRTVELLHKHSLDFSVVSGGIGNFIEQVMQKVVPNSVEILSNFLEFDHTETFKGFSKPTIHSLNKHEVFRHRQLQNNVLLIGDVPYDLLTVKDKQVNTLSIGFYNCQNTYDLETYKKHFDILVLNDGDFCVVEYIVSHLLGVSKPKKETLEELDKLING